MLQVYSQNQHVLLLLLAEDYDNYNDFVIFFFMGQNIKLPIKKSFETILTKTILFSHVHLKIVNIPCTLQHEQINIKM